MATVQFWLGRGLIALCLAGVVPATVRAAEVECAVGAPVQGEFGGGEIGTIAEIGSQPPHGSASGSLAGYYARVLVRASLAWPAARYGPSTWSATASHEGVS